MARIFTLGQGSSVTINSSNKLLGKVSHKQWIPITLRQTAFILVLSSQVSEICFCDINSMYSTVSKNDADFYMMDQKVSLIFGKVVLFILVFET